MALVWYRGSQSAPVVVGESGMCGVTYVCVKREQHDRITRRTSSPSPGHVNGNPEKARPDSRAYIILQDNRCPLLRLHL